MNSQTLKQTLSDLKWSQRKFAQKLGVDEDTVSRWCTDKVDIPGYVDAYIRLAQGYANVVKVAIDILNN